MNIKSSQTLVEEAKKSIETLSPEEVKKLSDNKEITLVDVRDIRELWNEGTIENSKHIPRGMLEVYLDPNRQIIQNGQVDKNKEFVLFCAGGVRSALAVKSLHEMGYEKVSHIEGGFGELINSDFEID